MSNRHLLYRLDVDFTHSGQTANHGSILAEQFSGFVAFYMPLPEAGIVFFEHEFLFPIQFDLSGQVFTFQFEQSLVFAPQSVFIQNLLDSWFGTCFPFSFEKDFQITASFGWILGT